MTQAIHDLFGGRSRLSSHRGRQVAQVVESYLTQVELIAGARPVSLKGSRADRTSGRGSEHPGISRCTSHTTWIRCDQSSFDSRGEDRPQQPVALHRRGDSRVVALSQTAVPVSNGVGRNGSDVFRSEDREYVESKYRLIHVDRSRPERFPSALGGSATWSRSSIWCGWNLVCRQVRWDGLSSPLMSDGAKVLTLSAGDVGVGGKEVERLDK